eukprot:130037-Chlamydomonas_euryale.AAC.2
MQLSHILFASHQPWRQALLAVALRRRRCAKVGSETTPFHIVGEPATMLGLPFAPPECISCCRLSLPLSVSRSPTLCPTSSPPRFISCAASSHRPVSSGTPPLPQSVLSTAAFFIAASLPDAAAGGAYRERERDRCSEAKAVVRATPRPVARLAIARTARKASPPAAPPNCVAPPPRPPCHAHPLRIAHAARPFTAFPRRREAAARNAMQSRSSCM